jgi:hypothetical protein
MSSENIDYRDPELYKDAEFSRFVKRTMKNGVPADGEWLFS